MNKKTLYCLTYADISGNKRTKIVPKVSKRLFIGSWFNNRELQLIKIEEIN